MLGLALPTAAISSYLLSVMAAKFSDLLDSREPGRALLGLVEFVVVSPGSHYLPQTEKTPSFFSVCLLFPQNFPVSELSRCADIIQRALHNFPLEKKFKTENAAVAVPMEIYYFNKIL